MIDVSGSLLLKFAETSGRKLSISLPNRILQADGTEDEEEAAEFGVIVKLAPEEELETIMMSSASVMADTVSFIFGMGIAGLHTLW